MTKRLTRKAVCKEILKVTGFEVGLYLDEKESVCHFYTDPDEQTVDALLDAIIYSSGVSTSVCVCRINHLSLSQWVDSFNSIVKNAMQVDESINERVNAQIEQLGN